MTAPAALTVAEAARALLRKRSRGGREFWARMNPEKRAAHIAKVRAAQERGRDHG